VLSILDLFDALQYGGSLISIDVPVSEEIGSGEGTESSGITMLSASSCRVLVFLNRQK